MVEGPLYLERSARRRGHQLRVPIPSTPPSLPCLHVQFSRPHEVDTVVPPNFTDWPGITASRGRGGF